MEETLERFAFDLSVRALERQERVVEELRARTGTLLAAGAFVGSLLGIRSSGALAFAGVASAVGTIGVCVSILLPNRRLEFKHSGTAVFAHSTRAGLDVPDAHRMLTYWNDSVWDMNQRIVTRLIVQFEVAAAWLVLAIVFWALSLGARLTSMATPKKPKAVPPPPGPPPVGLFLPERGFPKKK